MAVAPAPSRPPSPAPFLLPPAALRMPQLDLIGVRIQVLIETQQRMQETLTRLFIDMQQQQKMLQEIIETQLKMRGDNLQAGSH